MPWAESSAFCFTNIWTPVGLSSESMSPCGYKTPGTNPRRVHSGMPTTGKRALCFAFEMTRHRTSAGDYVSSIRQITAVLWTLCSTACSAYWLAWGSDRLSIIRQSLLFNACSSIRLKILHTS